MKRRLLKLEMERRLEEKNRAMKASQEAQSAASGARLARAGFRRNGRRASIMHVGAFLDVSSFVLRTGEGVRGPNLLFFPGVHVPPRALAWWLFSARCVTRNKIDYGLARHGRNQLPFCFVYGLVRGCRASAALSAGAGVFFSFFLWRYCLGGAPRSAQ